jgi:glutamate-ammonia-ligase adenylyltransferase
MQSVFTLPRELEPDAANKEERFLRALEEKRIDFPLDEMPGEEIRRIFSFSEFISRTCISRPEILSDLLKSGDLKRPYIEGEYEKRVSSALKNTPDDESIGRAFRQLRQREMVRIAFRDLAEYANLTETMWELSSFADACVVHAVERIHQSAIRSSGTPTGPDGAPQRFIVLAMGKLGAFELNFSSDIDLVFLYPDAGLTVVNAASQDEKEAAVITNEAFFTSLARRFLKLFGETSDDGILFRVDLRLRPYGASGPLVISLGAFEDYLLIQGREWERYAFIKARMITGDPKDQKRVEDILSAFVYRRYFDYASFDSLREMKQNIVNEVKRKGLKNNIKLGSGGIREIEFFGQIFQLIRGGVEPDLRNREILHVLRILAQKGHIPRQVRDELSNAYVFLRYTEHRLQEYGDSQTHELPATPKDQIRLATAMNFNAWSLFLHNLKVHMAHVHRHFSALLSGPEKELSGDGGDLLFKNIWLNLLSGDQARSDLRKEGFEEPSDILRLIDYLRNDVNTRSLNRGGRDRLNKLMPVLLRKLKGAQEPCLVLTRIIDLIKTIERRTCYIALLLEHPKVLDLLIKLANESPWIITYLSNHPVLLDELLDTRTLHAPPERKKMEREIEERMNKFPEEELESRIEELCLFKQVNVLRVAASDISGAFPLMKVSDYLTDIAESILTKVMNLYFHDLSRKYGPPHFLSDRRPDDIGFAIIAFGKLGGVELGYGSDLDLVFLHASEPGNTTGGNSIDNTQFYYRLGQKVIHALTARTSTGMLYEVDMRLRPSGSAGLIVSHIDAFAEYHKSSSWTFEHQAIVRARPICGDKRLFERFQRIRKEIICRKRDKESLRKEIKEMRERMRQSQRSPQEACFDLKQGEGGIVDIEFLVQYLVLLNANMFEEISVWTDNVRLLQVMAEKGVIEKETEKMLKTAYLTCRSRVHKLNLQEKEPLVPSGEFQELREKVISLWEAYIES